jgi:hypothetical protein
MTGYRVRFFKRLVNSQGSRFKTLQRESEIIEADTLLEAEEIAEREFERARKIADWHIHADFVETEVVVTSARKHAAWGASELGPQSGFRYEELSKKPSNYSMLASGPSRVRAAL